MRFEARHRTKGGKDVAVDVSTYGVRFGDVEIMCSYSRDITERKQAEEELRESEERYRSLVELSPDAIVVHRDGRFVFANSAAARLFGADQASDLIGRSNLDLVHPDFRDLARKRTEQVMGGRAAADMEMKRIRLDGTEFWSEARGGKVTFQGEPAVLGIIRDITERKRAERALRATEERLRAVATNAPIVLWAVDRDGKVTLSEGKGLEAVDLEPGELVGKSVFDFPEERVHLARALAGEEFAEEIIIGDKVYQTFYGPLSRPNGNIEGVMGVDVDITERKRAEGALIAAKEQAEIASRAKSEFLANTSHELRTPLNAIIGFAEMMAGGYAGKLSAKQAEYVSDIRESGAGLLEIINDILDLTKIESGRARLAEENLEVAPTVASAVRLIRSRADDGGLRLDADVPENLPPLRADGPMVKRILLNLLTNAVKFTPPGGEVTVSASVDEDGALRLSVNDTGIGISAEDLPKVVEPFGQVDSTLSRRYPGTGAWAFTGKDNVRVAWRHPRTRERAGHGHDGDGAFPARAGPRHRRAPPCRERFATDVAAPSGRSAAAVSQTIGGLPDPGDGSYPLRTGEVAVRQRDGCHSRCSFWSFYEIFTRAGQLTMVGWHWDA